MGSGDLIKSLFFPSCKSCVHLQFTQHFIRTQDSDLAADIYRVIVTIRIRKWTYKLTDMSFTARFKSSKAAGRKTRSTHLADLTPPLAYPHNIDWLTTRSIRHVTMPNNRSHLTAIILLQLFMMIENRSRPLNNKHGGSANIERCWANTPRRSFRGIGLVDMNQAAVVVGTWKHDLLFNRAQSIARRRTNHCHFPFDGSIAMTTRRRRDLLYGAEVGRRGDSLHA